MISQREELTPAASVFLLFMRLQLVDTTKTCPYLCITVTKYLADETHVLMALSSGCILGTSMAKPSSHSFLNKIADGETYGTIMVHTIQFQWV
jgi:hypothetical protein